MKYKLITIGNKEYKCRVTETEEERKKGLMKEPFLPPDEGMLFEFDTPEPTMGMKNTLVALDQIGIDSNDEVKLVVTRIPEDETEIPFPNCKYVLEVNANSGIKVADDFDITEDLGKFTLKVVGSDGSTQFLLQGGERIFSRISTRQIIKWAKKAEAVKNDKTQFESMCKRLGKRVFRELYDQDHREPQYVETPDVKPKDNESDTTE